MEYGKQDRKNNTKRFSVAEERKFRKENKGGTS